MLGMDGGGMSKDETDGRGSHLGPWAQAGVGIEGQQSPLMKSQKCL